MTGSTTDSNNKSIFDDKCHAEFAKLPLENVATLVLNKIEAEEASFAQADAKSCQKLHRFVRQQNQLYCQQLANNKSFKQTDTLEFIALNEALIHLFWPKAQSAEDKQEQATYYFYAAYHCWLTILLAYLSHQKIPNNVWLTAHSLQQEAEQAEIAEAIIYIDNNPLRLSLYYRSLLLFSCMQTAALSPHEIWQLYNHSVDWAKWIELQPYKKDLSKHIISPSEDLGPQHYPQKKKVAKGSLSLVCTGLVQFLEEQLKEQADEIAEVSSHLIKQVLKQLDNAPQRRFARIPQKKTKEVQYHAGFYHCYHTLQGNQQQGEAHTATIVDESPGGLQLGIDEQKRLSAGDIIIIQTTDRPKWQVANIRWLQRSPGQITRAGLAIMAPKATSSVASLYPATARMRHQEPCLLIPSLPHLSQDESIIIASPCFPSGSKLLLVNDNEERTIRLGNLISNTSHYIHYQFEEIDA